MRVILSFVIALVIALTLAAGPLAPSSFRAPAVADPAAVMRDAQRAVESGRDAAFEKPWRATLASRPRDAAALLTIGTLERLRYRYARADSFFERVIAVAPGSAWSAAARASMGAWRALGDDVPRADTLFARAHAEAVANDAPRVASMALLGLAQIRARRVGPRAGLELSRQARALLTDATAEDSASFVCFDASLLQQLGDTTAISRVREGIAIAKRSGSDRVWGGCELLHAQIMEPIGNFADAARSASHAVQLFESSHYLTGVANASQWLGYTRYDRGYFNDAVTDLERAVRASRTTGFRWVEAWAHANLSELYLALGDAGVARDEAALAAPLHAAAGDLWGLANDRRLEGLVMLSQRRYPEAATKFAEAISGYQRAGLQYNAIDALRLSAIAYMSAGRLDSARRKLDAATRLARPSANTGWLDEVPVHLARIAMMRGEYKRADSLITSARHNYGWREDSVSALTMGYAALEAQLALRQGRYDVADTAVFQMLAAMAAWRRTLNAGDLRAGLAQLNGSWGSLVDVYPDLVARLASAGHLRTAFELVEALRAREIAEGSLRSIARMPDSVAAAGALRRIAAGSVVASEAATRARLGRDEAMVILSLGAAGAPSTALVLTRDTMRVVSLAPREKLGPSVERFLRVAAAGTEPTALSRELGAALLQPIVKLLPPSIRRLTISPDGDLYRVPFDALRLADDTRAVERYAISLVPSATVAYILGRLPASARDAELVAIGDPSFSNKNIRLPRLRFSADEAKRVASYGARGTLLIRGDATETAVRRLDWPNVGVVHFATHALVAEDGPGRTALALAPTSRDDGLLTAPEIASLPIRGALVVLSGCESFGGQVLGGEGLRGLAAPLFEAGARAVVATHWPINDRSVVPFVDRFYAAMAAGQTAGDALRTAKLGAIRDRASIADWAAFTIIGDASMRPHLRQARR